MTAQRQFVAARGKGGDRRAFTIVELLIVVALLGLIFSTLAPALARAREQGRIVYCLNNLRQIGTALLTYMQDSDDRVPWVNPHPNAGWVSPYAWGGFYPPKLQSVFGNDVDYAQHDAESRSLNPYLAPEVRGRTIIPSYICPSDRSKSYSVDRDEGGLDSKNDDQNTLFAAGPGNNNGPSKKYRYVGRTWEKTGNSYAINWWWMNRYFPRSRWDLSDIAKRSHSLVKRNLGGQGSAFVVIYEAQLHNLLSDARPYGGGHQSMGWHGSWSRHTVLFFDGHAEYRYADTRFPFGDGWTIWPSPN